jgi:hypothetical protein
MEEVTIVTITLTYYSTKSVRPIKNFVIQHTFYQYCIEMKNDIRGLKEVQKLRKTIHLKFWQLALISKYQWAEKIMGLCDKKICCLKIIQEYYIKECLPIPVASNQVQCLRARLDGMKGVPYRQNLHSITRIRLGWKGTRVTDTLPKNFTKLIWTNFVTQDTFRLFCTTW